MLSALEQPIQDFIVHLSPHDSGANSLDRKKLTIKFSDIKEKHAPACGVKQHLRFDDLE